MINWLFQTLLYFSIVFAPIDNRLDYVSVSGRTEQLADGIVLIGSASSVAFQFSGPDCTIYLKSLANHDNYVSLELDGKYLYKLKIRQGNENGFSLDKLTAGSHLLKIFKATESANGEILFTRSEAKNLRKPKASTRKKIEFIGDSITCGMGNDETHFPCGQGQWFDQHNAYLAYGPTLSRTLDFDFLLSSVSGIGMYRNWNDEHESEAIMPDVYENLYLKNEIVKPYDFAFQPDVVSICLGTNDFSDGDGTKPRLPFDQKKFVGNYVEFIKTVYRHYPETRIVLLNSPMLSGAKKETLKNCLKQVILAFESDAKHPKIQYFEFREMIPKGCGYHPDAADHQIMADQLEPFFKKLLNEI